MVEEYEETIVDEEEAPEEEGVGEGERDEWLEDRVVLKAALRRRPRDVDPFFRFLESDGPSGMYSLSSLASSLSDSSNPE